MPQLYGIQKMDIVMKNKSKYIIIAILCVLVILNVGYVRNFIYGYKIPLGTMFNVHVNIKSNVVYISAETESSGLAFAGYDAKLNGDTLIIIPRYSMVSSFNRSGKLEIEHATEGITPNKIFLVGTGNDTKQIWPSDIRESLWRK